MKLKTILAAGAMVASFGAVGAAWRRRFPSLSMRRRTRLPRMRSGARAGYWRVADGWRQMFSIAVDSCDTWSIGTIRASRHLGTADGAAALPSFTRSSAQTFDHGTLVGRIGDGAFFKVGTSLSEPGRRVPRAC